VPIPFTVIGGFLGAGKTTLLNRVLREARDERVAVLVNDFGAINVDADLVVEHGGETIALANGCICCSIGDSLMDALIRILSAPQPVDRILVEASGVSDPARIADMARIDRALDGVVVLADAAEVRAHAADRFVGDAVRGQIAVADIVLLNKADLAGPATLAQTEAWLAEVAPDVPRVRTTMAEVPLDLILGGAAHGSSAPRAPGFVDHEARFARAALRLPVLTDRAGFEAALRGLPASVLRAKGVVHFAEDPADAFLLQKTGRSCTLASLGRRPPDGDGLVFIGTPEMPSAALLADALGGEPLAD
jgi:G3E family GTPase